MVPNQTNSNGQNDGTTTKVAKEEKAAPEASEAPAQQESTVIVEETVEGRLQLIFPRLNEKNYL